ncbi:U6 snRNA phosphodiesterase Usb1 [Fennellomyces sp. T-0311]|nr:U6 snRNA phosphodiesterase Usb1 [Fennellomyces sp. T-0311]
MLPLAHYESSSDEGSDTEQPSSAMPALPSFFSPATKTDDPGRHQGRVRTKPHIENNWATHVYVEVPASGGIKQIVGPLISDQIHSLVQEGDDEGLLHISLSRAVFLKEHQLDSFAQSIREHVTQVGGFRITFAQVSVLTNDEKTRSFITVEVGAGYSELLSILKSVDAVMEKFKRPVFYKPPRFHASVAWCLRPEPLEDAIGTIPAVELDDLANVSHMVTKLIVKMGNRVVQIPLSNS